MNGKTLSFLIALVLGCFSEGLLDRVVALVGNDGPCGFDALQFIFGLWHLPGMIVSCPLWALSQPDGHDIFGYAALAVMNFVGALMFTGLYYTLIRLCSHFSHEEKAA
jgi:hypothetical protein